MVDPISVRVIFTVEKCIYSYDYTRIFDYKPHSLDTALHHSFNIGPMQFVFLPNIFQFWSYRLVANKLYIFSSF